MDTVRPSPENRSSHAELEPHTPGITRAELGRLFYRQIAYDYLPHRGEAYTDETAIPAVVEGAGSLRMDHGLVQVRNHQLFILNTLVYLRDQTGGVAYSDATGLGFSPHTGEKARKSSWAQNLPYLAEKLNTGANQEVISMSGSGRWRRYHMHPGLELSLSDEYETKPEGFYEFAQDINGPLLRHNIPHTVSVSRETPIEVVIRDDDVIVTGGTATQLNEHDRALLQLMTFNNGRPLTFDQLATLGFHPYAPQGQGRNSALYRSIHRLNQALDTGDERPAFFLDTATHNSAVRVLRSYKLSDVRRFESGHRSFAALTPAFEALLRQGPEAEDPLGMDRAELTRRLSLHAPSLTLAQAYVLSLRLGVRLPDLAGTSYLARNGKTVSYDALAPHIVTGTPLIRSLIGELMGGQGDGSIHSLEQYGLHKLRNANRELEALRKAGGMAQAIAAAEDIPPEDRLDDYLTGYSIDFLLTSEKRPTAEREAVIAHFLPAGVRTPPRRGDLFNGMPWIRRLAKRLAPEILQTPELERLPTLVNRYKRASDYLLLIVGSPGEGTSAKSFAEITKNDPDFAGDGAQLIADILAVMVASRSHTRPGGLRS
ncbi:MAG TPA: hypothetical protein VJM32_03630 [Candidatus Saccharimonadales bacterium]|nr:hypothetical protein [Candidatus Saccharimonadales bacterium]